MVGAAGARRAAIRVTVLVVVLTAVAGVAAFVLGVMQAVRPAVSGGCADGIGGIIGRPQVYRDPGCVWEGQPALASSAFRTAPMVFRIEERDGEVRTFLRMTLPKDDPVVGIVRSGPVTDDPRAAADALFGAHLDDSSLITWHPETVYLGEGADTADVEVSSTEPVASARSRRVSFDRRASIEVDLSALRLGGVRGVGEVSVQNPTKLRGAAAKGEVRIEFAPVGAAAEGSSDYRRPGIALAAWRAVKDFLWPRLLSAVPWIVLVFLLIGVNSGWRSYRWLLAVLLGAHAVLIGAAVLSNVEYLMQIPSFARWIAAPAQLGGYPVISGSVVLTLVALGFLGAYAVRNRPERLVDSANRARYGPSWLSIGAVLWLSAVAAYIWMADNAFSFGANGKRPVVLTFAAIAGLLSLAGVAALVNRRRRLGAFAGLALLAVPLTVIGGLLDRTGWLPAGLRLVVPCAAAAAALITLVRAIVIGIGSKPLPRLGWVLVVIFAVGLGYPMASPNTGPIGNSWYAVTSFALQLDALLAAVLVVALGCTLYRTGTHMRLRAVRRAGIGCAFVVLVGAYSFAAQPSPVLLLAAAAAAWLLLPASKLTVAANLAALSDQDRREALRELVQAGEARRVLPGLRKNARDKVAAGALSLSEASSQVVALEREAVARDRVISGVSLPERAFGTLGGDEPGARARWGAIAGTLIGLPWTVLSLYGVASTLPHGGSYPILAALGVIVPQLLRWTAYGVLFGYFLPLLRGTSGLSKGLCLFLAVAVPTVADLIPRGGGSSGWQAITLVVVQTFSFAMTLGLLADRRVLRSYGHEGARLADVHNLGAVAAWASSVAISAGTALATALIVGLQPFLAGTVQPAQPPAPPPASSHP